MDLSFINDNVHQSRIPTPLSFKRNGCGQIENPNKRHDKKFIPDEDKGGKFFGASIRIGPHMSVQEDRVSNFKLKTSIKCRHFLNFISINLVVTFFITLLLEKEEI